MSIPNHVDVVKAARARYANKSGPERAYLVVNAVAWQLRDEGAGLFFKPGGTQFKQRSLDVVIFKEGQTFDILRDAEGKAEPTWSRTEPTGMGDPEKWRAPVDPDELDQRQPQAGPSPKPGIEVADTGSAVNLVAELKAIRNSIDGLIAKLG